MGFCLCDSLFVASMVKSGVRSALEMHMWPEFVVKAIFELGDGHDAERQVRFLANFPMLSSSDYSGLCGDRESLTQVVHAGSNLYGWTLDRKVKFTRACDISKPVRSFLHSSNSHWPANRFEGGVCSNSSFFMCDGRHPQQASYLCQCMDRRSSSSRKCQP